MIDSVELEKTEVCRGEEDFALVRARDDSGLSDRLIVRLGASREMSFRLPFRIEGDSSGPLEVLVQGGGGVATARVPEPRLKDCVVAHRLHIDVSFDTQSPHVLRLLANPTSTPDAVGPPCEPTSYDWEFGDGTKATTTSAELEHSYEGRPQTTRFSYFLIRATARDRFGREAQGSRAYGFPNFAFGAFVDDQRIVLFSAGGSAEGDVGADGEHVRIYHGFEGTVQLERVFSRLVAGSKVMSPGAEYSPRELLGFDELRAGASHPTLDLSELRPNEPGIVRELEIVGHAGSFEARGRIVLTSTAGSLTSTPFGG